MSHRRKGKGKEKITHHDSSEPIKDLPPNVPPKFTWEEPVANKKVMYPVIPQGKLPICWAIAHTRMIGAHLFIHDKVQSLVEFSVKHLFAHVEKGKGPEGHLKDYEGLKFYLKEYGLIKAKDCNCKPGRDQKYDDTEGCDKVKDRRVFKIGELHVVETKYVDETELIRRLKTTGPIAAVIEVTRDYVYRDEGNVYFGPSTNKRGEKEDSEEHVVLLTGYDTTSAGVSFFTFQNSYGDTWGAKGFGKVARKISLTSGKKSLIKSYMYPECIPLKFWRKKIQRNQDDRRAI